MRPARGLVARVADRAELVGRVQEGLQPRAILLARWRLIAGVVGDLGELVELAHELRRNTVEVALDVLELGRIVWSGRA